MESNPYGDKSKLLASLAVSLLAFEVFLRPIKIHSLIFVQYLSPLLDGTIFFPIVVGRLYRMKTINACIVE